MNDNELITRVRDWITRRVSHDYPVAQIISRGHRSARRAADPRRGRSARGHGGNRRGRSSTLLPGSARPGPTR